MIGEGHRPANAATVVWAIAAVGCATFLCGCTTSPRPPMTMTGIVDRALTAARRESGRGPGRLRLFSVRCQYGRGWCRQNATNALTSYSITFYDPAAVAPDPLNPGGVHAVGYAIAVSAQGDVSRVAHDSFGWSPP